MRKDSIFRIAMWASTGFLISAGWGLYFATADKATPIQPIVYTLARLSSPVAGAVTVLYPDRPIGLWSLVVANVATFALLGLVIETVRQHYRLRRIST